MRISDGKLLLLFSGDVIPSFAVGRTQHLLWCIHRLKSEGTIPETLPVYLNSPMAQDATAVYHRHRVEHRLSPEQCQAVGHAARYVNTVEESKALNQRKGPMVIIAGSGMASGGRVVHHLRAFAPDAKNMIVFAGFQAGGTRGVGDATERVPDGTDVMVSCAEGDQGRVYQGLPEIAVDRTGLAGLPHLEFIINDAIKAHLLALLHPEKVSDSAARAQIRRLSRVQARNGRGRIRAHSRADALCLRRLPGPRDLRAGAGVMMAEMGVIPLSRRARQYGVR